MENLSLYQNKYMNFSTKNYNSPNEQNNNNNNQSNLNINPSVHEESEDVNKKSFHFTPKMKKFFTEKFYEDDDFREDIRFQLAIRIYQFLNFLA